jgi:hypothetical protein
LNRVYLGIALALVLAGLGWFGYRAAYQGGYKAGSDAVRAEWNLDIARIEKAAREAQAREYEKHQEIERGLSQKLATADARGRDLGRRLRNALATPCRMPEGPTPGPTDGPAGESGDPEEIGEALTEHLAACERDAERLSEIQRFVK